IFSELALDLAVLRAERRHVQCVAEHDVLVGRKGLELAVLDQSGEIVLHRENAAVAELDRMTGVEVGELQPVLFGGLGVSHSGGCQIGSASLPRTVRTPRGMSKVQERPPKSRVVPLATATGALNTVSSPITAQRWRSCNETTRWKPLACAATARLRAHERLSERDLKV